MNTLYIRKLTDSLVLFREGQRLYAGSAYEARVDAPEFRSDTTSPATLSLVSGSLRSAQCQLSADPMRRGVRVGVLTLPEGAGVESARLRAELDGDVVFDAAVSVRGSPVGSGSGPSGRWTVVDAQPSASGRLEIADMAQARVSAPAAAVPLDVVPSDLSAPFEAYVVVTALGSPRFPFSGVLVNGAEPVWSHQDSFSLPSQKWVLHVVKVADVFYADLRAGRPGGAEVDPDGATVTSVGVNS